MHILCSPFSLGPCETLIKFTGTITISENTYYRLLKDVIESITAHSFLNICFINGHGGNTSTLEKIVNLSQKHNPKLRILFLNWFDLPYAETLKKNDHTYQGEHGDRLETEMMLLARPKSVFMDEVIDDLPVWPDDTDELDDYSQIMKYSVDGSPSFSSITTAKVHVQKITHYLVEAINSYYES